MTKKKVTKSKKVTPKKEYLVTAIMLYWLYGSINRVAKALNLANLTVKRYVESATDEEIEQAKKYSNKELDVRISRLLDLAFERLELAFTPGNRIEVQQLNTIWGTNLDKLIALRGLARKDAQPPGDINIVVSVGTANMTQDKPGVKVGVNRVEGLIDGQ